MPIINCFVKKKMLILIDLEINLKPIGFCLKIALGKRMFDVAQGKARVEAQNPSIEVSPPGLCKDCSGFISSASNLWAGLVYLMMSK